MAKITNNKNIFDKTKDKDKALELAIASLEKKHGKGIVLTGSSDSFPEIERISSGSIRLDDALNGGYARGRIIESIGMESCGKTSMALHAVAEAQKQGLTCAFIDIEHGLDIYYAKKLGVDTETLLISQPECGEDALDTIDMLTRSGAVGLIILDSVAALVPRAELEGTIGDSSMGLQARLMSQALRMLCGVCRKSNTTIIFINQIRSKIGVFFGSPDVGCGGNSLKYYASQRIDLRRIQTIERGEDKIGSRIRVKVIKNKTGPPFKVVEFNLLFNHGIDWATELLDIAHDANIIEKSGAWYQYQGKSIGQGPVNAAEYIEKNKEFADQLRLFIKEKAIQLTLAEIDHDIENKNIEDEEVD